MGKAAEWREDYREFEEATRQFYAGETNLQKYKSVSSGFGSYAQRGGKASMLRLRFPGGRMDREKLGFVVKSIEKYHIDKIHVTTGQTLQLHNLDENAVCEIAREALEYGIVTRGGGGNFPRNVMASPLSGVEPGEYFDVSPYVEAAGEYLLSVLKTVRLPRKLKVCFSNSPRNLTHATFRDLGFAAREDGHFDVYSAGGLGNNPRMGVKVAEAVKGSMVLYYIKAMIKLFVAYGNYENRGKARSRYMQDTLGDRYRDAFLEKLSEAMREENLEFTVKEKTIDKEGDKTEITDKRVVRQKQEGLYAVKYHPVGGCPAPQNLIRIYDAIKDMEQVELRLSPDETIYIVNCTGGEAKKILELTENGGDTQFDCSVACIGASICQIGLRDSQKLLETLLCASKTWGFEDGVLPVVHISGCRSSCGTHQIGRIGFRGAVKKAEGKSEPAYVLWVNGREEEGKEQFGEEMGAIPEREIPAFLEELGREIANAGMTFDEWYPGKAGRFREIAEKYTKEPT